MAMANANAWKIAAAQSGNADQSRFEPLDFMPRFEDPDDTSASPMSPEAFSAMLHALYPQD